MLASDWDESKVKFPVFVQPKIDGVRGLFLENQMTGRSLKPHANLYTTKLFSDPCFQGLDGELAAGPPTSPSLCRDTTSALNTIEGTPFVCWWIFDYITPQTINWEYWRRYEAAQRTVEFLRRQQGWAYRFDIVESLIVGTMDQLERHIRSYTEQGYEGVILRDPEGRYKEGRSTVREGGLLRIKEFVDAEIVVTDVEEGQTNNNVATVNELGLTSRSTHQENMVPNGMVGALWGNLVNAVIDAKGRVVFPAGMRVKMAPGCMTHEERARYFLNQQDIVGQIAKGKTFLKGVKDKPRFFTFQSIRATSDMG